jgi:hypothetical protein
MAHDMEITIGEVYRLVERVLVQTTATNGRLRTAEEQIAVLGSEMDEAKAAISRLRERQPMPSGPTPAVSSMSSGDLAMSAKRVAMGIAVVIAAVWGLVEGLFRLGDWLHKVGVR